MKDEVYIIQQNGNKNVQTKNLSSWSNTKFLKLIYGEMCSQ